ncbi:hypothetical protein QN372_08100 [Undibacterium sp. RTI2.1]|uniref:DUF7010 family protein n=1 Tax=unclassified Undibacterium TaxID=2630295 RepID=UPI002AB39B06|nr:MULTISPECIES: hypothetical protein [unclassified Undibacterium]MDY7539686.1 hypothetical protein [Undibacterium sp. 5I1]MEB0030703.1 hypothetical protein [Undibacterium sp. RTI2.1]MEB0117178.1 hypothetical protein [Undibacterium sp. RTI2.2]MEB0230884.1 hypothetical protein [Undibacterium sp. 10I3]MEB0257461.1 hypothetical protein [Undibacterium sp. 5I1]
MKLSITQEQQQEMRHAHYDGAPGVLVSGLVWIAATLVCYQLGIDKAVWTLLIGGVFIYPISLVVTKAIGRPAKTSKDNALNQLGMASTIWLILCCAMAYGLFLLKPALFFPAMMATVGSRYLIFASIYGRSIFWVIGVSLIVAANLVLFAAVTPVLAAGLGGLVEVLFAFLVFSKASKSNIK